MITLSTLKASRSSAPAAAAASTRILSSTVRPGAIVVACPSTARGRPVMVTGPKSNVERSIGGHPVVRTGSSRPHRSNAATPAGWMTSVDSVSLGKVERSTRSTRSPPAGQEHRGRGACTAGTDHDGVVVITMRWHDLIVAIGAFRERLGAFGAGSARSGEPFARCRDAGVAGRLSSGSQALGRCGGLGELVAAQRRHHHRPDERRLELAPERRRHRQGSRVGCGHPRGAIPVDAREDAGQRREQLELASVTIAGRELRYQAERSLEEFRRLCAPAVAS